MVVEAGNDEQLIQIVALHRLRQAEFVLSVVQNLEDYVVAALTNFANKYADSRRLYLCRLIWLQ